MNVDSHFRSGIKLTYAGAFQLSMTIALRDQLLARLEGLTPAPLSLESIEKLERRSGVYQLFRGDELVYVGKADRLAGRLRQHQIKLAGRTPGLIDQMSFRCVYVDEDLDAVAPEKMLIDSLRKANLAVWNTNGFGNNNPGKERDRSKVGDDHFDARFPINLDVGIELSAFSDVHDLASSIKQALPYTLRFADSDALRTPITAPVPTSGRAFDLMSYLAQNLPADWLIVHLPGYLIMYPDLIADEFTSRIGSWAGGQPYQPR